MRAALAAIAALSAGIPAALSAQTMRDFSAVRQQHGENRVRAHVEFAAGSLQLAPGRETELYRYQLRYDADRFAPDVDFNAGRTEVTLGVRSIGGSGLRVSSRRQLAQSALIALSPSVSLALDAHLRAAEAVLELGGLRLTDLRVVSDAGRATLRWSKPNPVRCASAAIEGNAAEMLIERLGDSRCSRVSFRGNVGTATLDLRGAWGNDAALDVSIAMGRLVLRVPRSLGVRVRAERFLASFPAKEWTREGNSLLSPGYRSASRRLDLNLASTIGDVVVEWMRE